MITRDIVIILQTRKTSLMATACSTPSKDASTLISKIFLIRYTQKSETDL